MSRKSPSVLGEGEQVVSVSFQRHTGGMFMNHLKSGIRKAKSGNGFPAKARRREGAFGEMGNWWRVAGNALRVTRNPILIAAILAAISGAAQAQVKISQIYGAGGNSSAAYNTDYVELYNAGSSAQNLAGWSIQYASATGTSWNVQAISGTIQPGKYFLVSLASGGSVGSALPTPDFTGTASGTGSVNLSATNGKLALANSTTAFSGTTPTGAIDFVGFGTASTYEGSGAAPAPSTSNAIYRAGAGATDTNDNKADFTAAAASPRNSLTGGAVALS